MSTIEEKRVYEGDHPPVAAYVASADGLVRVAVAGSSIGAYSLALRGAVTAVAAHGERVAAASPEGVFDGTGDELSKIIEQDVEALGYDGESLVIAPRAGGLRRRGADGQWTDLAIDEAVSAVAPPFLGGPGGVYRIDERTVQAVGLGQVSDLVAHPQPLAATQDGLFELANGWQERLAMPVERVAANGDEWVALTAAGALRRGDEELPPLPADGKPVDISVGETVYVLARDGSLFALAENGWRRQVLGVSEVTELVLGQAKTG